MSDQRRLSRRRFIQLTSSVAVATTGGIATGCGHFQPAVALTDGERRTFEALADQIIPPDGDAGGKDAGLADFLDRQLRGPHHRYLPVYRDGLARLDQTAQQLHRKLFADLPFDMQNAVLVLLEQDQAPPGIWKPGEAPEFFRLAIDHCMQGYYGSPRHGGNRDSVSWKMLGLDYPQLAGRVVV